MLYNKNLLKKSYETSKIICSKLTKYYNNNKFFILNNVENFKNDGIMIYINNYNSYYTCGVLNLELKQRQNYLIRDFLDGKKQMFNELTIQKSTVENNVNSVFVIYDLSMNCCMIFDYKNINLKNIRKRMEVTEIGVREIEYYTIKKDFVEFIDLKNVDPE